MLSDGGVGLLKGYISWRHLADSRRNRSIQDMREKMQISAALACEP